MTLELTVFPGAVTVDDRCTGERIGQIEVGPASLAERQGAGEGLDAGTLERAIDWTEDRIQQARLRLPAGRRLATRSPELLALARIAGLEGGGVLHRGAVEQVFSRLVLQAHGAAPQALSLPGSANFAATLVLLRELMHHLGFETLHVHEPEQPPPPKGQPR